MGGHAVLLHRNWSFKIPSDPRNLVSQVWDHPLPAGPPETLPPWELYLEISWEWLLGRPSSELTVCYGKWPIYRGFTYGNGMKWWIFP